MHTCTTCEFRSVRKCAQRCNPCRVKATTRAIAVLQPVPAVKGEACNHAHDHGTTSVTMCKFPKAANSGVALFFVLGFLWHWAVQGSQQICGDLGARPCTKASNVGKQVYGVPMSVPRVTFRCHSLIV